MKRMRVAAVTPLALWSSSVSQAASSLDSTIPGRTASMSTAVLLVGTGWAPTIWAATVLHDCFMAAASLSCWRPQQPQFRCCWPSPSERCRASRARILLARARSMRQAEFVILARSTGVAPVRLLCKHVMPNLRPVLLAQFWISVPIFILSEANLSILGLGVAEPLPSLGSLLRELETVLSLRADIWRFAPLVMLVLMVGSLQIAVSEREVSQ